MEVIYGCSLTTDIACWYGANVGDGGLECMRKHGWKFDKDKSERTWIGVESNAEIVHESRGFDLPTKEIKFSNKRIKEDFAEIFNVLPHDIKVMMEGRVGIYRRCNLSQEDEE